MAYDPPAWRRAATTFGVGAAMVAIAACGARGGVDDLEDATPWSGANSGAGGASASATGAGPGSGPGSSTASGSPSGGPSSGSGAGGTTTSSGQAGSGGASSGTSGPGSSSGSGGQICPGFGDPCTECMSVSCSDAYCGCYDNSACFDFFGCLDGCNGDQACNAQCAVDNGNGVADAYLLSDCAATTCNGSCAWGQPIGDCGDCALVTCEAEWNTCFSDLECLYLWNCLDGCPQLDLECQQQCYADHGAGVPNLQSLLDCIVAGCGDVCN